MARRRHRTKTAEDPLPLFSILMLVETAAAGIAVAISVVPGRTGSTWSFAELVWQQPSLLQKIAAAFVVTNVLLAVLGVVGCLVVRADRAKAAAKS